MAMWDGLTGGLNFSLPGNGGPQCLSYSSGRRKLVETLFVLVVCLVELYWSLPRLDFPACDRPSMPPDRQPHRHVFTGVVFLVFLKQKYAIKLIN